MTSTVTTLTINTIASNTYDVLSATVGIVAIGLVLALLLVKELWRAYGSSRMQEDLQAFDAMIVPLLVPFVVTLSVRFIGILLAER